MDFYNNMPAAGGKFLGILETKNTFLRHFGRVFRAKTLLKSSKFPACGGLFSPHDIFLYKNASKNPQKFSACGGHIVIEIRLVCLLMFFFAPAVGHHSVFVFYACLQGASTQAQNSEFFSEPAAGPNHSVF